jgi:putative transposase
VRTNNSYHTEVKCLARENLLAKEITARIPRSNIWRWRHEPSDKYKSFDLNLRASQDYDLIRAFSQSKKAKRVFSAYVRLSKFFVAMAQGSPKFQRHVHAMKIDVVKVIERVKDSLGFQKALQVFGISVSTFRQWRLESYTSCFNSIVDKCNRIYPTQLSSLEVRSMREKLIDPVYQFWPISSIAFDSLRNGSLPLCLNTWYKYAKRLGVVVGIINNVSRHHYI